MSHRLAAAAGAALALFACTASAAPSPAPKAPTDLRPQVEPPVEAQLKQAFEHLQAERCDEALPLFRRAFGRREFRDVDQDVQAVAYETAAVCELGAERFDAAIELLQRADKIGDLHEFGLQGLFLSAYYGGYDDQAVAALERFETAEAIAPFDGSLLELARTLAKAPERAALRRRLLAVLHRLDFEPAEPFESFEGHWAAYARMLQPQDPKAAAEVAARVTDPDLLLDFRLDARFAALVEADPARFDLRAAAERKLAADRAAAEAHPKLATGPMLVAQSLRMLGRADEALAVLDDALARLDAFEDGEDQRNWLLNDRAYALYDLGRFEEALATMRQAAGATEKGDANVSQTINLALMLVSTERPEEALTALKPFGAGLRASAYGDMWAKAAEACALAALDRKAELGKALAWMRPRENDNPAAHARARLCAGDLDAAAAVYVRRLADPEQRSGALESLSEFDPPAVVAPEVRRLQQRLDQVRARPDVKAAIARVGRVERVPLSGAWGDF